MVQRSPALRLICSINKVLQVGASEAFHSWGAATSGLATAELGTTSTLFGI
jgi:hypothetical protein